jgi:hypothetical protein
MSTFKIIWILTFCHPILKVFRYRRFFDIDVLIFCLLGQDRAGLRTAIALAGSSSVLELHDTDCSVGISLQLNFRCSSSISWLIRQKQCWPEPDLRRISSCSGSRCQRSCCQCQQLKHSRGRGSTQATAKSARCCSVSLFA